ncbi:MAG: class B sortase [Clostridia bacterium]|nr:class B sortase [Clostridia bacterium]
MADNNRKDFSTNPFDDFPDFDSLETAYDRTDKQAVKIPSEIVEKTTEKNAEKPEEKSEKISAEKSARSPAFAAICAALCIAIIGCVVFSAFRLSAYMASPSDSGSELPEETVENIYTNMSPNYSTTNYPSGIMTKLAKDYAANNDTAGWLYIPGTNINTPLIQGRDNNQYLRHNFFGVNTNYGNAYIDSRCSLTELDRNTVIYGHNMPSGTHFYDVNRYEDIEWYRQHPVIKFSTLYRDYTFLIYTAFYTNADSKDDGGYIFNYIAPVMGPSSFAGYIEQVNQRALYKTDVSLATTDKVITLSTCNHTYDRQCGRTVNSRLVVVGRLLHEGESEEVNVSAAKARTDYRRPQIWYTVNGKTNPYSKSRTWFPSAN